MTTSLLVRDNRDMRNYCSVDDCVVFVHGHGLCTKHYTRWLRTGTTDIIPERFRQRGFQPGHSKFYHTPPVGDHVTYGTVHWQLGERRGPASNYPCVDCNGLGAEWSYDHSDPNELIGLSSYGRGVSNMVYSTDLDRYQSRCKPCHVKFDRGS